MQYWSSSAYYKGIMQMGEKTILATSFVLLYLGVNHIKVIWDRATEGTKGQQKFNNLHCTRPKRSCGLADIISMTKEVL